MTVQTQALPLSSCVIWASGLALLCLRSEELRERGPARDGAWTNPAGLLGDGGWLKAPLQAVLGAHTPLHHPFLTHGHTHRQLASPHLEQEQSTGTSLKPEEGRGHWTPCCHPA